MDGSPEDRPLDGRQEYVAERCIEAVLGSLAWPSVRDSLRRGLVREIAREVARKVLHRDLDPTDLDRLERRVLGG